MTTATVPPSSQAQPAPKTVSQVLGEITWLLTQSPLHKNLFITDLEWFAMPAILLEQFRLYHGPDQRPAGLILWASIPDDAEARLLKQQPKLAPHEWNGGNNLWLIEMVAPFGGQDEMLAEAAATIFAGKSFKYQIVGPNGIDVITHSPTPN